MRIALGLAARGLGNTWPNPSVGCVLVREGRIVGRGWTQPGGRPHAETEALQQAGDAAQGATAYVTLEPCAHHGRTPPCAEALAQAGIARCVTAMTDPDPRVRGEGHRRLAAAGMTVREGVLQPDAEWLSSGFVLAQTSNRPLVKLKLATSLDARIATQDGSSRWITGPAARARTHLLRARYDAVMVGIGTALADDPELTCRLPGLRERSPVRIVMDSRLRLPLTSRLVHTAKAIPTWLVSLDSADPVRLQAFADCGVEVIQVAGDSAGLPEIGSALAEIAARGINRLLVEGGGRLAAALVRAGLVDRIAWFRAGSIIGGDGIPAVAGFGLSDLGGAPVWRRVGIEPVGDDTLETLARPL